MKKSIVRETVIPEPDYRIPVVLLGSYSFSFHIILGLL